MAKVKQETKLVKGDGVLPRYPVKKPVHGAAKRAALHKHVKAGLKRAFPDRDSDSDYA